MRNMQKKTGAMTTILLLCSVFLLLPGTCIAAVAPNIAWECETNSECDDGIFCNGAETCSGNLCYDGTDVVCPGGFCDNSTEQCVECLTNNNCEIDDICLDNVCVAPGPLDNIWLELKISSKASAVDADNGTLEKETIKTTAYMNIRQDGDVYQYIIICEIAPDVWSDTQHGSIPLANPTEDSIFMDGTWWELATQNGTPIRVLLSGQFKLKLQNGELKKAAFSSLGAYIADSDTKIPLYGGIKITGKTIDEDKLPALN